MSKLTGPLRLAPLVLAAALLCATQGAFAQSPPVAPTPTQVSPEVDKAYTQLMASPAIQKLLDAVKADHDRSVEDLKMLTEIEAPPFKEQKRAEAFLARMKAFGLTHAKIDAEGNVVGLRKGTGNGPKLLISAHLDTVFPAGTDVKVKERDGKLYAPGVSDDTRGLSVLLSWLKVLNDNKIQTVGDLLIVGNVGEEELGNLRGIKAIFRDNLDIDGMVGLEPAPDGSVLMLGTGSHRYEVTFKGPGGHSYGAFGRCQAPSTAWAAPSQRSPTSARRASRRRPSPSARSVAAPRSTPLRPMRAWRSTSAPTRWRRCSRPRRRSWRPSTKPWSRRTSAGTSTR